MTRQPEAPGNSSGNRLIDAATGTTTTWAGLPSVETRSAPAAYFVCAALDALAVVAAHAATGAELLVAAAGRLDPALADELRTSGFMLITPDGVTPPAAERVPEPGRLWLLTSGSTGRPKRIGHTLGSLTTVSGDLPSRTWLCPYSAGSYAWWQLVTLGLTVPGQDLVFVDPVGSGAPESWLDAAVEHGVTAASGTPTFWRRVLLGAGDALAKIPLAQVTLGGEPVDQSILDRLRAVFPDARISWIYASSEVGASIVVHDGRAGFPVDWLDRDAGGRPVISVRDGELVVASPHHGVGLAGAVRTGDAVRIEDGRVLITGRLDRDEINVGGSKVSAGAVRGVLQDHPAVAWAAVRGRTAPLVGSVVVADVVLAAAHPEPVEAADLSRWAAARLPDYAVPRRITILPEIPVKETLKSDV